MSLLFEMIVCIFLLEVQETYVSMLAPLVFMSYGGIKQTNKKSEMKGDCLHIFTIKILFNTVKSD